MTLPFLHEPADIVRELLVQLGLGTEPAIPPDAWPVYATKEPGQPDECLTVYTTTGTDDGRTMHGQKYDHLGVQVRIRAANEPTAFQKAELIRWTMAEVVDRATVVMTVPDASYLVYNFAGIRQTVMTGKEAPNSQRSILTLNVTLAVERTS